MDPTRLMTQDATVTPRSVTTTDEYNDDVLTDGTPYTTICFLWQTQRSEDTGRDNIEAETFQASFPPTDDLAATYKVTVDGVAYEIDGPPWAAFNPRLREVTHQEVTLRRVS